MVDIQSGKNSINLQELILFQIIVKVIIFNDLFDEAEPPTEKIVKFILENVL